MRRRELDELTDREREVLALLRRDFTNEQIAQRLGISLDGAKYHVSQILSKLGVATREEAAAVALAERRRWWAQWPLWARIAGAATVAAAVAGLAVLAWGVLRTGGTSEDPQNQAGEAETPSDLFRVEGFGMDPTLSDGMFVDILDYGDAQPQRGDIIVFRSPLTPREFIKRVIGLPGETIEIRQAADEVMVNGTPLDEPYARKPTVCFNNTCSFTIPAAGSAESMDACGSSACYFVLGDNRQNSSDSRMGWLVPAENIIGWTPPVPSSRTPPPVR